MLGERVRKMRRIRRTTEDLSVDFLDILLPLYALVAFPELDSQNF